MRRLSTTAPFTTASSVPLIAGPMLVVGRRQCQLTTASVTPADRRSPPGLGAGRDRFGPPGVPGAADLATRAAHGPPPRRAGRGAGESRTHTVTDLNRLPLPLGYGPDSANRHPPGVTLPTLAGHRPSAPVRREPGRPGVPRRRPANWAEFRRLRRTSGGIGVPRRAPPFRPRRRGQRGRSGDSIE